MTVAVILYLLLLLAAPSLPQISTTTSRTIEHLENLDSFVSKPSSPENILELTTTLQTPEEKIRTELFSTETVLPTRSEPTGHVLLDGFSPENEVTAALPTSGNEVIVFSTGAQEITASQNGSTETSTSQLVNGKGRPEPCSVCECWSEASFDLVCQLPRTTLLIRGQEGSHLSVTCQNGTSFSCAEFPWLPPSRAPLRLELRGCAPPPLACLAPRLPGTPTQLYLFAPPDAQRAFTREVLEGVQLEKIALYGSDSNATMEFPREALSTQPSLRSLTINNVQLVLRPRDLEGATELQYLELSRAGLGALPTDIFAPLAQLRKLMIWSNRIEEIKQQDLQGLRSLQQLDVSGNALRSLEGVVGAGLPSLAALSARDNPLEELPPLAPLAKLETVLLFQNKVPLKLDAGALASLPRLTSVDLRWNQLAQLPADLLHNSSALRSLKLCNNKLTHLPEELFRDLAALEELDLSGNRLAALRPRHFQPLTALKKLLLNNNQITALPSHALAGLCSLTRLSLSHNQLGALSAAALGCGGASALQHIDLSHNQLTALGSQPAGRQDGTQYWGTTAVFAELSSSLRSLDLSHNLLQAAPDDVPSFLQLRELRMGHNNISALLPHEVSFVSAQAAADYSHNRIATVRLPPALPPAARPLPPWSDQHRATVRLGDNPFECDCKMYHFATRLHGYKAVSTLEARLQVDSAQCAEPPALRARPLASLPLGDLVCSSTDLPDVPCAPGCECLYRPHTEAVELTCSQVPNKPNSSIPGTHFELQLTQPNFKEFTFDIRVLNLSGLALEAVPDALPQGLRLLDLTHNSIHHIPRELLQRGVKLRLAGNAFPCDCTHRLSLRLLREFWDKIEDAAEIKCSNGAFLTDVSVESLCSTRIAMLIGIPLALIGVLTAVVAVLFLRYSLEIRVWLHARGLFKHWLAIDDEDRKYDAFISFCHKDEAFVTEQLVPGLEKGADDWGPYKLCVHYRDWVPGEWIPAQIARSVADSRRTIIVVSKNFLDSLWGRAEFRTANMSAVKERETRVIVILLEDISSHKELDPELKAYLSTNTYLKWGDPWFWEKLRYALPHKREAPKTQVHNTSARSKRQPSGEYMNGKGAVMGRGGLPHTLSPAGMLVPSAVPPTFKNKCEQFDIEIGDLKKMDIADLKPIKTVS